MLEKCTSINKTFNNMFIKDNVYIKKVLNNMNRFSLIYFTFEHLFIMLSAIDIYIFAFTLTTKSL